MPGGSFAPRRITESIERSDTAFATRIADSTTNRLDASGTYDFNTERHIFLENGTFIQSLADTTALTDRDGKFQVTAAAGDEHIFGGRELIRYVPNYELLFGTAAWADAELSAGQHFAIEFSRDTFTDGYRYHFEGTADGPTLTVEQVSNGTIVDSVDADLAALEQHGYDHTAPAVARGYLNWYGAGLCRYELSYPTRNDAGDIDQQRNEIIGRTANDSDTATEQANRRVQVRVWCDSGAADLTVNICSLGALVRGNATQVNREKAPVFWDIGGSISQYPVDNVDAALAARIDPDRDEVVVDAKAPKFAPAGSDVAMEMLAITVHNANPDLSVNFADPDDDGTDEGPTPAAQSRAQTDIMQFTRDVTSIPTSTDIRADGTEGEVPDGRYLTGGVGISGGGNNPASATGGESRTVKHVIHADDVVLFIPRTDPAGNTTGGRIRWLKLFFEQDW
jgi:hypothetical protein